ncbi:winged helix-turn-helix domain-containing protein [Myxococcus sp. K38C18041901]|uniref:winged helix-turn-helix domain-containing protein n=1 Tax=Myxococcus guangdongensis TaxID=2906760 RepID=UPI0020A756CE|nr:winged helix-turn-helix domain-containing protein [Myxococcus guangdongensis]MCP3063346.1 winged helix-turn-helix domain-containing protein [Myxococcus guangdongensis]
MFVEKMLRGVRTRPTQMEDWRRLARDLGDAFCRQESSSLSEIRVALADLDTSTASDEVKGYFGALADLTAAYEASLAPLHEEAQVEQLARKDGWKPLLRVLQEGPILSGELATRTGKHPTSISKRLHEMRDAGLVHLYAYEGLDGRERPYRLTLRGQRVAKRLGKDLPEVAERIVAASVAFFARLAMERQVFQQSFHAFCRGILAGTGIDSSVLSHRLAEEGRQWGLLSQRNGLYLTALEATSTQMKEQLENALSTKEEPSFFAQLRKKIPPVDEHLVLFRASDLSRSTWMMFLKQGSHPYPRHRLIDDGDLDVGLELDDEDSYSLVYESLALCKTDAEMESMRPLIRGAHQRICLDGATGLLPEGFSSLQSLMHHEQVPAEIRASTGAPS